MEKYVEIKSPFTGGKVKEVSTVEEHEFRKEQFSVHVRYYVCEDTSERFTTTEQDELLFNELYSQYRVNHGIPFPEEIKSIRLHYGLNYQQITKILGFGVNQYAQYEKGQMPSESNGKLLSATMNRQFMLHLLEDSRAEFGEGEYNKVYQSILASEVPSFMLALSMSRAFPAALATSPGLVFSAGAAASSGLASSALGSSAGCAAAVCSAGCS